jgi:hypothetical protein
MSEACEPLRKHSALHVIGDAIKFTDCLKIHGGETDFVARAGVDGQRDDDRAGGFDDVEGNPGVAFADMSDESLIEGKRGQGPTSELPAGDFLDVHEGSSPVDPDGDPERER